MFLNISAEPLQTTCIDNACDFTDIEFIMSLLLNVEKKYQIENYKCCCTRTSIIIHCLQLLTFNKEIGCVFIVCNSVMTHLVQYQL